MQDVACPVERARSEEMKAGEEGLRWDICVDVHGSCYLGRL